MELQAIMSKSVCRENMNAAESTSTSAGSSVGALEQAREVSRIKIATLKSNPLQATYMEPLSEAELRALAEDMRERGQRQAIEILLDGTIIDGHQRVEAARLLKWVEIDAVVRHDLVNADEKTKAMAFLSANLNRRHMTPLARARVIKAMLEAERGCKPGGLRREDMVELSKRVCEFMGRGDKSVERYLHVLNAPPVVQHLFEAKLLKLDLAVKIGVMVEYGQTEKMTALAEELEGLTDRAEILRIVERYIPSRNGRHKKIGDAVHAFVTACQQGLADLEDRAATVPAAVARKYTEPLQRVQTMLTVILKRATAKEEKISSLDVVSNDSPTAH